MKKIINNLIASLTITVITALPLVANDHIPTDSDTLCIKTHHPITDWGRGNQTFTTNFYSALIPLNSNENFIFSPLSLQINLSMVSEFAQGDTQLDLFHFAAVPHLASARQRGAKNIITSFNSMIEDWDGPSKFIMANKVWFSKNTVSTPLTEGIVRDFYLSEVDFLDFQNNPESSRQEINNWVDDRTLHQIPELMSEGSITTDSRVVLVNTFYMRSPWQMPFDPELTDEAPFYGLEKSLRTFPYMHQTGYFAFSESSNAQIIDLPFQTLPENSNRISLIVIVPKEGVSIDDVELNLMSMTSADSLLTSMQPTWVNLTLPRFKVSSSIDAKSVLQKMGLSLPFSEDAEFEFSGEGRLAVTDIIHQAVLEVNERGGVASAGTGTSIGLTSMPEEAVDVVVNRPFLFFVVEKEKGLILFAGRIKQLRLE